MRAKISPLIIFSWTVLGVCLCPSILRAEGWEVGPTVGVRFGGRLIDQQTGNSLDIEPSPAMGLTLGRSFNYGNQQAELVYSRQDSEIDLIGVNAVETVDITVEQYYFGLTRLYDPYGSEKFRPFLEGLIGATQLNPDGYKSRLFFSLGAVVGIKYFATKALGFRLDGRVFSTFTNGSTAVACSGGCVANYSGSVTWQGEISPSVFLRF